MSVHIVANSIKQNTHQPDKQKYNVFLHLKCKCPFTDTLFGRLFQSKTTSLYNISKWTSYNTALEITTEINVSDFFLNLGHLHLYCVFLVA